MRRELVPNRTAARRAIEAGRVEVKGVISPRPATMVDASTPVRMTGEGPRFASRGGEKLAAALNSFDIPVEGRRALDAGASTGGFVDCLLQNQAASVTAVDVGYGQLDWRIASDPRVTVMDRTNLRHVSAEDLGAPFDVITADLSFISLELVMGKLAELSHAHSDIVVLVKPQFELDKGSIPRGGIVTDRGDHRRAITRVEAAAHSHGLTAAGLVASPVTGAKGNREFLMWLRHGDPVPLAERIEEAVAG